MELICNLFPLFHFPKLRTDLRASIALFLCAVVLAFTTGCTQTQIKTAVQDIANNIPTVETYISTAAAVADTLDPAAALVITAANGLVQTSLTELQVLLNAYATSPSATTWGSIVDAVNTIVNTNANSLLNAVHIVDATSRARALEVLGALQTALLLVYSIIQRVSDKTTQTTVAAQAADRTVKLSQIKDYLDKKQIETATGYSFNMAFNYEVAQGF
jgi:hypothetical protein